MVLGKRGYYYQKQVIEYMESGRIKQLCCEQWDPGSLGEVYAAHKFRVGTVIRGRDDRKWVVIELDSQHKWALSETETPIRRNWFCNDDPQQGRKREEIPLCQLDWWVWSTLPGIERFCVRDCGTNGDCFFASVAAGLQGLVSTTKLEIKNSIQGLRHLASSGLLESNIESFLEHERKWRASAKSAWGRDPHVWDLEQVRKQKPADAVVKMRLIISEMGNLYWGDNSTLELLCNTPLFRELRLGFLLFRPQGIIDPMYITSVPPGQVKYLICLYNNINCHWRLVVFHDHRYGQAQTCIKRNTHPGHLPTSLHAILQTSWLKEWRRTFGY